MARRKRTYDDPVENLIGVRNVTEDAIIAAIDKKYSMMPIHVGVMVDEGYSFADIKKALHIGDMQLVKALKEIRKDTLAKKLMEEKT